MPNNYILAGPANFSISSVIDLRPIEVSCARAGVSSLMRQHDDSKSGAKYFRLVRKKQLSDPGYLPYSISYSLLPIGRDRAPEIQRE